MSVDRKVESYRVESLNIQKLPGVTSKILQGGRARPLCILRRVCLVQLLLKKMFDNNQQHNSDYENNIKIKNLSR